jgi:hypothetical protein
MSRIEQAMANVEHGKQRFAPRWRKITEVLAVREGRWNEIRPGFFPEEIPEPMIANFIDVAAQASAEAIAPLPTVSCANPNMSTDAARKAADKRTKIANHYVTHSNLSDQNAQAGDHIGSFGFTVYTAEPDFSERTPCIYVESAIGALYQNNRRGETVWFARCFQRDVKELMAEFPAAYLSLARKTSQGENTVEVVRYMDADGDLLFLAEDGAVLMSVENVIGRCRAQVAERPKVNDVPRGQYDDVVWIQMARARFANLTLQVADDVVNAPIAVPRDVQDFEVGNQAVLQSDTPEKIGRVRMDVPNTPFVELGNLQNELRLGGRHSEMQDGQTDASIITGKGVQALLTGSDGRIKTLQGRLASALTDVIEMCFEMDERLWPDVEKSITGLQDGAPYEVKYKPSRDIAGNYTCSVSYGLTAGLDPNRALVFLLQGLTSNVFSRDTVMREMPFDLNVTDEQKKIYVEGMRDALMGNMAALAQAIPAMAMQGGDPTDIIMKVGATIQALQKGNTIEDAVEKAFPPPPPPEAPAEEQDPAAGGVPPGPQGQGAPPEAGGGSPPAAGGAASDLLMALAGTSATGAPNLSFGVSKRRPV